MSHQDYAKYFICITLVNPLDDSMKVCISFMWLL